MPAIAATIERHHKGIIFTLGIVVLAMAASCTFHDLIPVCHWVFGCDHGLHIGLAP